MHSLIQQLQQQEPQQQHPQRKHEWRRSPSGVILYSYGRACEHSGPRCRCFIDHAVAGGQDKGACFVLFNHQSDLNIRISMMSLAGRTSIANSKPSCFFCGSKRQRNLVLVGEDALGNPELIDFDGMGVHRISKAIKYRADYKKMRWIYWSCLRCFCLNPSKSPRYRDINEKKEVVVMQRTAVESFQKVYIQ